MFWGSVIPPGTKTGIESKPKLSPEWERQSKDRKNGN